jgi:nucleotidyltransferase-like protein
VDDSPRLALAKRLAAELRTLERTNLVAVGVYGSVAYGNERPHSDVDLLVVVRRRTRRPWARVRRGFLVTFNEMTPGEAWDEVSGAHLTLAEILSGWKAMRPLHDPSGLLRRCIARARHVPRSQFRRAAREGLFAVYEDLGKVRDALESRDRAKLREMAIWYTGGAAALLCLLDRHPIPTGEELLLEVQRLGTTGKDLARLRYGDLSIDEAARLTEATWAAIRRRARRQRIAVDRLP